MAFEEINFGGPKSGEEPRRKQEPERETGASEESPEQIRGKTEAITGSASFEDLYATLRKFGNIKGKSAEEIIDVIKTVEDGVKILLNTITRAYGLRPTVERLYRAKFPNAAET